MLADVTANAYQDFRSFPDGSVAYAAEDNTASRVRILRILPCEESARPTPARNSAFEWDSLPVHGGQGKSGELASAYSVLAARPISPRVRVRRAASME